MSEFSQFELVENESLTTSGFELRINVARHSSTKNGEVSITNGCATFGEFDTEVRRLIENLEQLLTDGETRFADGPFKPSPLNLNSGDEK